MSDDTEHETTESTVMTVFGSTRRDHRWHLTDELQITTALGRALFDLREVDATAQEVEIHITCALGRVDVIVPPGTSVALDGSGFVASAWSDISNASDEASHLPRLVVTATTILGKVRIYTPDRAPAERSRFRRRRAALAAVQTPAIAAPIEDATVVDTLGSEAETAGASPLIAPPGATELRGANSSGESPVDEAPGDDMFGNPAPAAACDDLFGNSVAPAPAEPDPPADDAAEGDDSSPADAAA